MPLAQIKSLRQRLRNFLWRHKRHHQGPQLSLEELRYEFQTKYHNFKLLLNANNKALDLMSEIEESLKGTRVFGMTFVRSRTTQIVTNVYQMIKNLDAIAPNKYGLLYEKFKEIQTKLDEILTPETHAEDAPLVIPITRVDKGHVELVGSKLATLGEVSKIEGINIPPGFVITTEGYRLFLRHNNLHEEIQRRLQVAELTDLGKLFSLSSELQQLIITSEIPQRLLEEIESQLKDYTLWDNSSPLRFAVRSSALGEDSEGISFAGQYKSELNVSPDELIIAYKSVVGSKYGLAAMTYRYNHGIRDEDVLMGVGVIQMIEARSSGVMYTVDPITGKDVIILNSTWGLPKAVVDGSVTPDLFVVSKEKRPQILERSISQKLVKYSCLLEEGICREELNALEANVPSLNEEEISQLKEIGERIEEHFGTPQDIEWILDREGRIWVLQTRPLAHPGKEIPNYQIDLRDKEVLLEGGITASPGASAGKVFVLRQDADTLRFQEGSILVTSQALPRLAPLLSRARGVIAELGSVTGHLANVAREFKVPALFGLKGALEVLEDGMEITLCADHRLVLKGIHNIKVPQERPKAIMEGTPVYETLKSLATHILPLTLLDPDSLEFHPKNVKTLHDITRFCHEKSVIEMFDFGNSHGFSERSSKQLICDVPMQFWVINLDDGFKLEPKGNHIHIEDITSLPMLALWKGMVKVPWKGPPALNTRGFMSILLEATQNPNLEAARSSEFAVKNYFMVSKNYCSLQSRFGFHFSSVEALLSDRTLENYISFQFKGGAANLPRRVLRAKLVSSLLADLGFKTQLKEDHLFARIEGHPLDFMEKRLMALGYLIIHTRQLDMAMDGISALNTFRANLQREIEEHFNI